MAKARGGFPPMGGGNMAAMMKQAQKMQEQMAKAQEEIEASAFEAVAGGGMVKLTMNGKKEVVSLEINDEVVNKDEKDMLIDMLIVAFNDAVTQVDEKTKNTLGPIAGPLGL